MTEETLNTELQPSTEETPVASVAPVAPTPTSTCSASTGCCSGKNTLGLVALILAIIGLLLTISLFGSPIGIPLLFLAFILGIIALFKSPRGKARTSVIISGITLGGVCYILALVSLVFVQPTIDFGIRLKDEIKNNPTMEAVFKQP